ncbi:MAG: helix-turn-helix transcriptional regulator [Sphingomonas sp.]|nr:helix-turn-helix transcriptional regulator [Sphingomonas sp.]
MKPAEFIECREALGLSRQEMASKLRMAAWGHQTIGDWEAGKREIPGTVSLGVEYLMFLHACDFPLPEGSRPSRWCNFGCGRGPSSGGFGGDV